MKSGKWPREVKSGNVRVKIYRVKHATSRTGFTYVLSWITPTGRKRQKFAGEAEALSEARLKADQFNAGRIEGAEMTRSDRDELQAARVLCGGIPIMAALNEWSQARELTQGALLAAAEAWKARHRAAIEQVTVSVLIDRFLVQKKKDGLQTGKNHKTHFEALRRKFGDYPITSVTEKMLTEYLNGITHPVSRNTHRKRMVTLWRWAQKKKYLPQDIKTEADQTERAREEPLKIGIISTETFAALLAFIRKEHFDDLPALVLAGFCGLRRSEIHDQTWEDVNLDEKHVHVTKAKQGTPARRLVPLSDAAFAWLKLCTERKGPICTGLAIDRVRRDGIAAEFVLPENCFRHSYISHACAASGDVARTSLDAGNSPTVIHRHYRSLVTKSQGETWFNLSPI